MNIIVCIKQVPSTTEVRMDPVSNTIIRDARASIINPFDSHAVEAAVRLREHLGGEISVISMGIPATEALLRDAIARGADRGMLLTDRAFAGADTLATSYTLACGIRKLGEFSLILCGKMAVDGDTAQIGPELAEHLDIPHVTDVCEILTTTETHTIVRRIISHGWETLRVPLPALLTVTREVNVPRLPSLAGVRRSLEAQVTVLTAADLDADPARLGLSGSPTQVLKTYAPQREHTCRYLTGTLAEQTDALCKLAAQEDDE